MATNIIRGGKYYQLSTMVWAEALGSESVAINVSGDPAVADLREHWQVKLLGHLLDDADEVARHGHVTWVTLGDDDWVSEPPDEHARHHDVYRGIVAERRAREGKT